MAKTRNHPVIILLSGYLGSGKDTVGTHLAAYGFKRYAFADALKDEVAVTYSLDRASMDTQQGKKALVNLPDGRWTNVRALLISHGQMRRAQDINYWVTRVGESIIAACDSSSRVVITDWRFPNEYHHLIGMLQGQRHEQDKDNCNWDIFTLRISRWTAPPLQDESELALDSFPFSFVIDNKRKDDSLLKLKNHVDHFVWGNLNISWLIVDVDDVLLDWMSGFRKFLSDTGRTLRGPFPQTWDFGGWIERDDDETPVDVQDLVKRFNSSPAFGDLAPLPGAAKLLTGVRSQGKTVVAVSSCTPHDSSDTIKWRRENLDRCFPSSIARVICLPLGAKKEALYSSFKHGRVVVVDDKPEHVIAAVAAGHNGVLFKRPWTEGQECNDDVIATVDSHEKLLALLNDKI